MTVALSPVRGAVVAQPEIPDSLLRGGEVGAGLAVRPTAAGATRVVAPLEGTLLRARPDQLVIRTPEGRGLWLGVGVGAERLAGYAALCHRGPGEQVGAGDTLVSVDFRALAEAGAEPLCPVLLLDARPEAIELLAKPGDALEPGDALFRTTGS